MPFPKEEYCAECGAVFKITLNEAIHKFEAGMSLPKRCQSCRKKRRLQPNPYEGLRATMKQYPSTKGHRHTVHGGVL